MVQPLVFTWKHQASHPLGVELFCIYAYNDRYKKPKYGGV
ncbi:hypothetical protein C2W64_00514 [Brevibacillus laterosporus]|nr:hypothetical protein C2W64_00514 [Brevibacillus laterosporus]